MEKKIEGGRRELKDRMKMETCACINIYTENVVVKVTQNENKKRSTHATHIGHANKTSDEHDTQKRQVNFIITTRLRCREEGTLHKKNYKETG